MRQTVIYVLLAIIALLITWYLFFGNTNVQKANIKPLKAKIDSLNKVIETINNKNILLQEDIDSIEVNNQILNEKIGGLNTKIVVLKKDLRKAQLALSYTPTQVDSFFMSTYPDQYNKISKDTTRLPLEVSKAAIVDIKESQINSELVAKQDTTIQNLTKLNTNKDSIIGLMKQEEINYLTIIDNKSKQDSLYKIQLGDLKKDIKSRKRQTTSLKIRNIALTLGVIGILLIK